MNSNIKIHICPVKRLPHEISALEAVGNIAAVLCTANDIQGLALENIKYLHEPFADVLDEKRRDAFTIEQACRIRAFVDSLDNTSHLFFCCDMGESRSAALAACFMSYLEAEDEMTVWKDAAHYHPNYLVYHLQSVACDREITREDALELAEYNRQLFHRLITRQKNG